MIRQSTRRPDSCGRALSGLRREFRGRRPTETRRARCGCTFASPKARTSSPPGPSTRPQWRHLPARRTNRAMPTCSAPASRLRTAQYRETYFAEARPSSGTPIHSAISYGLRHDSIDQSIACLEHTVAGDEKISLDPEHQSQTEEQRDVRAKQFATAAPDPCPIERQRNPRRPRAADGRNEHPERRA